VFEIGGGTLNLYIDFVLSYPGFANISAFLGKPQKFDEILQLI
jgi:hypothetical protein